ncbi:hypothetical protein AVEN_163011-1 [Araneus ventricosus]|uniref:Uncharacterized protein n=1 Tax=Araneus ventricosus TaxID=182803 RepID=A0A4Y2C1T1_ARAVE|nr:hypothetical protein AVEN_163011-1 [Araneus ventricosus]
MLPAAAANESAEMAKSTIKLMGCCIPHSYRDLEMYLRQRWKPRVAMTLWKIYKIDKSLLISALGLVGVYMGTLSMPIDEAAETPKCSPGTSNTVSPFDISPVPNIKKRTTTRGRKATRSSLITGSPYKDQLTKSL